MPTYRTEEKGRLKFLCSLAGAEAVVCVEFARYLRVVEGLRAPQPVHRRRQGIQADNAAALPDGLDTLVGRHGAAMSGGEAHRLALARLPLAAHDVVVLDEPTSHLDAATAGDVVAGITAELNGRTVVVLAHDDPPAGCTRVAALQAPTSASAAASI